MGESRNQGGTKENLERGAGSRELEKSITENDVWRRTTRESIMSIAWRGKSKSARNHPPS
eukprot:scaffold229_cov136-Cylindrotheca_fusiformis.AAC.7